jgi:hypothetical protein
MALLREWLDLHRAAMPEILNSRRKALARQALFIPLLLVAAGAGSAATWTPLANRAPSTRGVQLMVQLTDGAIMVQAYDGQTWMKLTPDITGSYINGTWTYLASSPVARLYFASQILPDGRFVEVGGEYSGPGLLPNWSNTGEIYDPVANTWTPITPYPGQAGCPRINYVSGNLTSGSPVITGIYPYTTGLVVGWTVGGSGIPAGATILSVDSPTQITISASATATRSASEVAFNHNYTLTACLGDDPSILLPDGNHGKMLVGDLISGNTYIYDANLNTWTPSGAKVYPDSSDEEGWAMTTNGTILNYDLFESIATGGSYAETYNPATGAWTSASPSDGSAAGFIPQLSSPALGYELGPLIRLQDGRMLVVGATQHTAIYNPSTTPLPTWAAGPDISGTLNGIPAPFGADDAPAAILPNGHVIFAADAGPAVVNSSGNITAGSKIITNIPTTATFQVFWGVSGLGIPSGAYITSVDSPTQVHISANATSTVAGDAISWGGTFSNPTQLFDFNPATNTISPVSPAIPDSNLLYEGAYPTRMLVLPTGQLLFSDSTAQLWIYTPDGVPNPAYRPAISGVAYSGGGNFTLTGLRLNGQSAGASYGDDDQMNSNYPIVRMATSTGKVYYARTSHWSKTGVDGGASSETVNFTLDPAVTPGNYTLVVIGAGIASFPVAINITAAEVSGI